MAKGYPYANIPAELAAIGNPNQTLDVRYPLSSWNCGKKVVLDCETWATPVL